MAQYHFPPQHWCYALEMACVVIQFTSRKGKRNERVLLEIKERCTPDLSRFIFALWHQIKFENAKWFSPNEVLTTGRLSGYAPNNGNLFIFKVIEDTISRRNTPFVRWVVQETSLKAVITKYNSAKIEAPKVTGRKIKMDERCLTCTLKNYLEV